MIINRIYVKNFKNFEEKEITLSNITFFKGENGSGKSTIALESILFALFGYTSKETLSDLPTRNKAKSCHVEVELEHKNDIYRIRRSYPTALTIHCNNKELKFATLAEASKHLSDLFGSREAFCQFRIVDAYSKEADILSQGQASIKKIIFSLYEDVFNKAKERLQTIKGERERYNKEGAIVYIHYPSNKRLEILNQSLIEIEQEYTSIRVEYDNMQKDYSIEDRQKAQTEGTKFQYNFQKNKLLENKKCYVCNQSISEDNQKVLIREISEQILNLNEKIQNYNENLEVQKEIIESKKIVRDNLQAKKEKINRLKMRLETRMKQIEFKYTNRDVLIVKKALEELDKLSSYYLSESVKVLEPIINSILEKINFRVSFTINEKNHFTISLQKDGIEYKQKDLSTGQKLLLQIAFKLAMLIQKGESGLIIADEGLGALDENNLLHVINIFRNLPFQLFLVLHNCPEIENVKIINLNERE